MTVPASSSFPEHLPTIELPYLSLAKVTEGDAEEAERVFDASRDLGCFWLDLSDHPLGRQLLQDVDKLLHISKEFCDLDLEEKNRFPFNASDSTGYKPMGAMRRKDGSSDTTEIYSLARDIVLQRRAAEMPSPFVKNHAYLAAWTKSVHYITTRILSCIVHRLNLPSSVFDELHDLAKPSGTILRVNHNVPATSTPTQASLPAHTDSGTMTILFSRLGGLQLLPAGASSDDANAWRWVKPEPHCAMVIIGEALAQWTARALNPVLHRVLHAPGGQAMYDRYSFGYFLKPAYDAPMYYLQKQDQHMESDSVESLARYDTWYEQRFSASKREYK